ncbi:MAG: hypothetical protein V3S64_09350 [bacterium]
MNGSANSRLRRIDPPSHGHGDNFREISHENNRENSRGGGLEWPEAEGSTVFMVRGPDLQAGRPAALMQALKTQAISIQEIFHAEDRPDSSTILRGAGRHIPCHAIAVLDEIWPCPDEIAGFTGYPRYPLIDLR